MLLYVLEGTIDVVAATAFQLIEPTVLGVL
jgi:hypothetical protein